MDRRLIDLELEGYLNYMRGRQATLDMASIKRHTPWVSAWLTAYLEAFDAKYPLRQEELEPNPKGETLYSTDLSERECRDAIQEMTEYRANRVENDDRRSVALLDNWLPAFSETFTIGSGDVPSEVKTPEEVQKMQWKKRHNYVGAQLGKKTDDPAEDVAAYTAWYKKHAHVEGANA